MLSAQVYLFSIFVQLVTSFWLKSFRYLYHWINNTLIFDIKTKNKNWVEGKKKFFCRKNFFEARKAQEMDISL